MKTLHLLATLLTESSNFKKVLSMGYKNSILLLMGIFLYSVAHAQQPSTNYTARWTKVDSLINQKGLTQSALTEVNSIYTIAKKEKNDPQLIKALIYRINLEQGRQEDAIQKSAAELEKEILSAREPAASILNSILAECYWNYFQVNRWKLYDRKNTINFKKTDIATWSAADFLQKISSLYIASLRNEKLLEQTKLDPFNPLIIPGNARYLRPTLFDLLAQRALNYFKSDEPDISRPAYAFEINDPSAFTPANEFILLSFKTKDSASVHHRALLLFQQLIRFHLQDAQPDAFIDVDLQRIQFVYQYGVMENKENLYFNALKKITSQHPQNRTAASAWYLQAQFFANKAGTYDPLRDTSNRLAYLNAKSICENISKQSDSSQGKSDCERLLQQILRKEMLIETEKVNVPDKPFRMLISYRNYSLMHFRLIRLDRKIKENLNADRGDDHFWKPLTQLPALKTFYETLPETGDYQLHRVEIKIDALEPGTYCLLASMDKSFSTDNNHLAAEFFDVSKIAFINNGSDYFVLNRETGQPMQGTDVQVWYKYYDNKVSKWMERKGENFNTDRNGFFHINPAKTVNYNAVSLEFTGTGDHLWIDEGNYNTYYNNDREDDDEKNAKKYEASHLKTFFFMDRAIYRPGQIAFFKGILITKDFKSKKSKILSDFKTTVYLTNANNQRIDSMQLTTNEFGSYHGQFKLPQNVLTGEFSLEDSSNDEEQSFSVEEYKRPKFQVDFDQLKGSYRVKDSIRVTGFAKAYAGNNISNGDVKYRVIRQARFPYPWLYGRWGLPRSNEQEIAHGEVNTNADGKFTVVFLAAPDNTIDKKLDPVFDYNITADVTDINGETRSKSQNIAAGYKAINITLELPQSTMPSDSLKQLIIRTENLSRAFVPTMVTLNIYALKSPDRLIRERFWQQPDKFLMSKEEYIGYFPKDEYRDETDKETWAQNKIYEKKDSSRADGIFSIDPPKNDKQPAFWPGWYLIEANASDQYGQTVTNRQYVQLYDAKTNLLSSPQYLWVRSNFESVQPQQNAFFVIGSSASDVSLILRSSGQNEHYDYKRLSSEKKTFAFPITESDRGGYSIGYAFVKDNRIFSGTFQMAVPWTNKELTISYSSYRDKTLPGADEKWKLKIAGYWGDKVSAEVLASMYDASLDQFRAQAWSTPDIYPSFYRSNLWNGRSNFSPIQSVYDYWNEYKEIKYYTKQYDLLLSLQNLRPVMIRGVAPGLQVEYDFKTSRSLQKPLSEVVVTGYGVQRRKEILGNSVLDKSIEDSGQSNLNPSVTSYTQFFEGIQLRKNFNETAFFFPDLRTDDSGNVEFSFTMPEALTQWKWMTFAHTKELAFGYSEKKVVTQKQLMVQLNAPRFIRQGDHIELAVKIVNLTDTEMTGQAQLQLINASTNQSVDGWFSNRQANQYFTASAGQSTEISFPIDVPFGFRDALTYRIVARSGNYSDGEEASLPVLSNRMLVTESLPLNMRGPGTKSFKFEKLLSSGSSETLTQDALTVEFTGNPAWFAVQSLPYITEFPYECAEQTFNRFYGNALAAKIANTSPQLHEVFKKWQKDTSALLSNLQKNEELKSVLLQETPWVLQANTEAEQKKNIALLFDIDRMSSQLENSMSKIVSLQSDLGGFSWFKGGPDDRYITQYILTGIGHLKKMDAIPVQVKPAIHLMVQKALVWLDKKILQDYLESRKRAQKTALKEDIGSIQIQYLYLRSFFSEYAISGETFPAVNYFRKQAQQSWLKQSRYMQGMIALFLFRTGDLQTAHDILASLKQNAIIHEELGMYWKENIAGYYWYQAPVETQSLLIEAFAEITKDFKTVNDLKTWLLKQKQTQHWATTKATADACYALLLQGSDWLATSPRVDIRLGDMNISPTTSGSGEGYFKKNVDAAFIKPALGNITVTLSGSAGQQTGPAWGAVYWQYFEDMNKIGTSANNSLRLSKKLFVQRQTDRGVILEPVAENAYLKVGDRVTVRIELKADRDMEYVHMKDMRASCMEPLNVLSAYKWQRGLGYYESTRDASTNFFFSDLRKGTYVFEYELLVSNVGTFNNGITTIQCMYAPEFMSHSEGVRVNVENQDGR
jgi:hypothetical protein